MTTHVTTQISSTRPVRDDLAGLPATTPPVVRRDRGWALAGLGAAIAGIVGTGGAISINAVYDASIAGDAPAILDQLGGDVVGMVVFQVGAYFAGESKTAGRPFLNDVPVRFGIDDPGQHYHVPLLVSPFSYTTYRGS